MCYIFSIMLKNLLVTILTFAVISASGQHAGRKSRKPQQASYSAIQGVPVAAPLPPLAPELEDYTQQKIGSKDKPLSISLPDRGFADWIGYGANLALVAVGIGGIWVAVCTLKKIERQTSATEQQLAIQRETLRPRLTVSNVVNNAYEEAALGNRVCVGIKIANSGGMPAYGVIVETWMEFIERGSIDQPWQFSSKAKHNKGLSINVDTAYPQAFEIPFNRSLTDAEIAQLRSAQGTICLRIRLTYFAFNKECHFDHAYALTPGAAHSIAEYISAD